MELRVLSWNLFHGRDHAPDRSLHTWRSRLLRITERGERHAQVNRDLFEPFAELLAAAEWDVALLQECPPRWAEDLATLMRAEPHLVLTARNLPAPLNRAQALAARLNPDLIASWEGGANLTLVRTRRVGRAAVTGRLEHTLTRRPETRRMALTRLAKGPWVANLHASGSRAAAERELARAAAAAVASAAGSPLIFGGDYNLRPSSSPGLFTLLRDRYGLVEPTGPTEIDHILASGLRTVERPAAWRSEAREVPDPDPPPGKRPLPIRLSDHAPIEAAFELDPVRARP